MHANLFFPEMRKQWLMFLLFQRRSGTGFDGSPVEQVAEKSFA
jgi:hypothetical protein